MKLEQKQIKNVRQATLLSIIPGLGQFYNKQNFKGIVFRTICFVYHRIFAVGLNALIGLVTLGSVPGVDHSLFLMIEGTLQLIVTLLFIGFWFINIFDARRVAMQWNLGETVNRSALAIIKICSTKVSRIYLHYPLT